MSEPLIFLDLPCSLKAALLASASTIAPIEAALAAMQFGMYLDEPLHPLFGGMPSVERS